MEVSEQTAHKKQKTFFDEIDFVGSDRVMILNKPKLLEMIEAAYNEASIVSLRNKIFAMREHLTTLKADKEGLLNIGTNGDTVQLNQKYLFGELKQIVEAQTLERSKYYLRRLAKAVAEQKTNRINDLNLNRWKEHEDIITDSLWVLDRRDTSGVHKADYWGNFIPQIPNRMMKRFSKEGECVLDPFARRETTLVKAQRFGGTCIGIPYT